MITELEDFLWVGLNWVNYVGVNVIIWHLRANFAIYAFWWFKHSNFSEIELFFRLEFRSVTDANNYVLNLSICNKIYFLVVLGPFKTSVIKTTHISNFGCIVWYAEKVAFRRTEYSPYERYCRNLRQAQHEAFGSTVVIDACFIGIARFTIAHTGFLS